MNTDNRRVYIFITIGLIAAVIVGVAVWRAGTPVTPSASDTATQTPEVSTVSEASRTSTTIRPTEETDTEQQAQAVVSPEVDDPYLAPNAVVHAAPQTIEPTVAYRPENVTPYVGGDTSTATEPTEPGSSEPTRQPQQAPGTESDGETDVTDETTRPAPDTGTPTDPTDPTEPGEPTDPTEAGEPTEPTTPSTPDETVDPDSTPSLTPDTDSPESPATPAEEEPEVASLLRTTPGAESTPEPSEADAQAPAQAPAEPQRAQTGPLRFWPFSSGLS